MRPNHTLQRMAAREGPSQFGSRGGAAIGELSVRPMAKNLKASLSFAVMAGLIFILSHFLLYNSVSTGPNQDLSFGWLELHRYGEVWSIEHFRLGVLALVVGLSILLTWAFSKMLRRRLV